MFRRLAAKQSHFFDPPILPGRLQNRTQIKVLVFKATTEALTDLEIVP